MKVMFYSGMPGYQVTRKGGVALYPGENYLADDIAVELIERDIVRPALEDTIEAARLEALDDETGEE